MPKPQIEITTNIPKVMQAFENFGNTVEQGVKDSSNDIAQTWIREAQRKMMKNGNVVTGTGLRSLEARSMGDGMTSVYGAGYLDLLDSGTPAHFVDSTEPRFIAAARSYGMDRNQLASVIAEKGTRPHPWKDETNKVITRKSPRIVNAAVTHALKQSFK